MSKAGNIKDAISILSSIHAPANLLNERSSLVLLALAGIGPKDTWNDASVNKLSIVGNKKGIGYPGIMQFMADRYRKKYAENSRETIRRNDIHTLIQLGVVEQNVDDPNIPTNSSRNHYSLLPEFVQIIKQFGLNGYKKRIAAFVAASSERNNRYIEKRLLSAITIVLPDATTITLSPGAHNELQGRIIELFLPTFSPTAEILYIGDTADKYLYVKEDKLKQLGLDLSKISHTKLPDVVLHDPQKNWLFLIEAVTSHGPIGKKRMHTLEKLSESTNAGVIYVTAFLTRKDFKKFAADIAWESECWIADEPEHMIHFNGDRFYGPR